jgi:hypothetical protein
VTSSQSARLPGATSPAGDAINVGQAGPQAPECGAPPARPTIPTSTCGHLIVLHDISKSTKQRTACSVTSGPKADRCGCRRFEPLTQEPTP